MAGNAEGAGVQRAMQGQCKKRAQAQRHGPTATTKLSFACPLVAMEFGPKHGAIAAGKSTAGGTTNNTMGLKNSKFNWRHDLCFQKGP